MVIYIPVNKNGMQERSHRSNIYPSFFLYTVAVAETCWRVPMDLIILLISNYFKDK